MTVATAAHRSIAALALAAALLDARVCESQPVSPGTAGGAAEAVMRLARSVRTDRAPDIDGRDDEPMWRAAPLIDGFRTFDPVEDGEPRFRTEARVVHDARNLYAFVRAFDARLDYTIRPTLSVQLFAEPFVSAGRYSDVQALTAPGAARWADRFTPLPDRDADGFNSKRFRSNAVMRWEYRPGSTLFVVWQQGRDQGDRDTGSFDAWRDYRNLFGARPDNTLLVKASYWFGR